MPAEAAMLARTEPVVLVTGAAPDIGRGLATGVARRGGAVALGHDAIRANAVGPGLARTA